MEAIERTIAWTYADSGDARLDRQHESLIHLTEALNEVIGGGGGAELGAMLCDFLGQRLERHFRTEEAMIRDKGDSAGLVVCRGSHERLSKMFTAVSSAISDGTTAQAARAFNTFRLAMACHDRQIDGPLFERIGLGGTLRQTLGDEAASRIPLYADSRRPTSGRLTDGIPIHDG